MDSIKLLPDHIANQIAAGEVVQRPASVVKELVENAIDAGATDIKLIVKEGGALLIQVIDNGAGMGPGDAIMCWERHATSKIRQADDLFRIRSFGFRGEALASIAAIAHVEMKTRRRDDELGTNIRIEGSRITEQSQTACPTGTQFSIKNLFYNVPARRNFLKSTAVEFRHIIEEFTRASMPHPEIAFSLLHNDREIFTLRPTSASDRVAELLGRKNGKDFLEVNETHELLSVHGFVGKPETAKRSRGEQYLFVNKRFIKDPYLNHAISNAYEQLISKEQFPLYALFLETDPGRIDVNIHPTKTEIKFEDERAVYSLVKSAVRKALGQYVSVPELEFSDPNVFNPVGFIKTGQQNLSAAPEQKVDRAYNPFGNLSTKNRQVKDWQQLFGNPYVEEPKKTSQGFQEELLPVQQDKPRIDDAFQLADGYIVASKDFKLILIDQRAAHERILFEQHLQNIRQRKAPVQQLLFPRTIELSGSDYILAHEIMEDMKEIGFDVADFGTNCLIINGVPAETARGSEKELLEGLLEYYRNHSAEFAEDKRKSLAVGLAQNEAILRSKNLEKTELLALLEDLFACENPAVRPNGKPVYVEISRDTISSFFR